MRYLPPCLVVSWCSCCKQTYKQVREGKLANVFLTKRLRSGWERYGGSTKTRSLPKMCCPFCSLGRRRRALQRFGQPPCANGSSFLFCFQIGEEEEETKTELISFLASKISHKNRRHNRLVSLLFLKKKRNNRSDVIDGASENAWKDDNDKRTNGFAGQNSRLAETPYTISITRASKQSIRPRHCEKKRSGGELARGLFLTYDIRPCWFALSYQKIRQCSCDPAACHVPERKTNLV